MKPGPISDSSLAWRLRSRIWVGDVWLVAAITLVAAILRLHMLAAKSLWIDEAASVSLAGMHWVPFLKLLWAYQGNMALYYVLLRFWIHLGDSEFLIRSLSAGLGIVSIPALYVLGKRLLGRRTALIGAGLLAVHSFHIRYSQEARAYALLPLMLIIAAYFLVRALETPRRGIFWAWYAVSAALAVYAHIFAVLVLAAHALALAWRRPLNVSIRTLVGTVALFAFLISPMAAFVVLQHSSQISWVDRPGWREILQAFELLTGSGGAALLLIYLGLCASAFFVHGDTVDEGANWGRGFLLAWFALPPVVLICASFLKPMLVPRYLVMCVPALVLLAANGISNLTAAVGRRYWPVPLTASLVLVLSLSLWGTRSYFLRFPAEDDNWRGAVHYILQRSQPSDGVVFYIPNAYSYDYYARRAWEEEGKRGPVVLYPPPHFQRLTQAEVEHVTTGHVRIWLVLHLQSTNLKMVEVVESALGTNFHPVEKRVFPGGDAITVILYDHNASAAQPNGLGATMQ